MATDILKHIHNDLKLLIKALSGFTEGEEGFRICERFALSQVNHHSYLTLNKNDVKKQIEGIKEKFLTYGKYKVADEFDKLVQSFLTSFDFERHPQFDIQWALLSFLINLSAELSKSELSDSKSSKQNVHKVKKQEKQDFIDSQETDTEEIDWSKYLKESEIEFFNDFKSDSEDDEWSDDENDGKITQFPITNTSIKNTTLQPEETKSIPLEILKPFCDASESEEWLNTNIQNSWWNELEYRQEIVCSPFDAANLQQKWKTYVDVEAPIIGTISEYKVCRELLWMFQYPTNMAIFKKENLKYYVANVSIPSLTQITFNNILSSYCSCFSMLNEMEIFIENIFSKMDSNEDKYPHTYEAYASALQGYILKIRETLLTVEIEVMKQESHNSLLAITKRLRKTLKDIKMFYTIHKKVINNTDSVENWKCASGLLSKLYIELENAHNQDIINACACLYLFTFSVYLKIVDTWLSEGRLEDWKDEFIIVTERDLLDVLSQDDVSPIERFTCRELDTICKSDPLLQILLNKVYQMGQSVHLLSILDRISDFWNLMDEDQGFGDCLNEMFLIEVKNESLKYDNTINDETDANPVVIKEITDPPKIDAKIDIKSQISSVNNPFLCKVFDSIFGTNPLEDDTDGQNLETNIVNREIFSILNKSNSILPWRKIFESSLNKVLDLKFSGASKLVKNILMDEYKLAYHLKLMRSVFMMETSHVMNKFCILIFSKIESSDMWNHSYYITSLLEEVLSLEWPDSTSRWSVKVANTRTTKVLEAINGISVNYAAGWPINMLLTDEAIEKYNTIFRFELKLKWAQWTLNTLRFGDLENREENLDNMQYFCIRRLESLRFWMLHAIGSIHAYLSGQVFPCHGSALDKALGQAETLEAIIITHSNYLEEIYEQCFQSAKFDNIITLINKLLEMCHNVKNVWNYEAITLILDPLDSMEREYVKYHTQLALALHNTVQYKDADYLTGISSAFNCSIPSV